MRRVIWSDGAVDSLEEITNYVRTFNPAAAAHLEARLAEAADGLAILPARGRPVRPHVRELTTVRPYILRYTVLDAEVRILTIRHSARRPAP